MIKNVIQDLRPFLLFYLILLFMFSNILSILGIDNYTEEKKKEILSTNNNLPGFEYELINKPFANFLVILRYSLGDFQFESIKYLGQFEAYIFWITWIIMVIMTCVVFLNFIIAEVSESYNNVQ
jgi:hypothetical protein